MLIVKKRVANELCDEFTRTVYTQTRVVHPPCLLSRRVHENVSDGFVNAFTTDSRDRPVSEARTTVRGGSQIVRGPRRRSDRARFRRLVASAEKMTRGTSASRFGTDGTRVVHVFRDPYRRRDPRVYG